MSESEIRQRAAEAQRLLDEPLLVEAFDALADAAIGELMACRGVEPEDDRRRFALVERLNVIRAVRDHLAAIVGRGRHAASRVDVV